MKYTPLKEKINKIKIFILKTKQKKNCVIIVNVLKVKWN